MGLFDAISGALNPDIISTYNDIINNHSEAFQRWKGRQIVGTLSELFWYKPTFQDKKYIAQHKNEILQVENEILEEKAFEKRRKQVIEDAKKYPHAFVALIKKLSIPSIPDFNYSLPGSRKSNRAKRLESESRGKNGSISHLSYIDIKPIHPPVDYDIINLANKVLGTTRPKRSLDTLSKDEYEKIFPYLSSLSSEETKILCQLKDEENIIKFDDEILENKRRTKYYKHFLCSQSKSESDIEFCISHLPELDKYIHQSIHTEYLDLKRKYPKGVQYCEDNEVGYGQDKEEVVVENHSSLQEWENIVKSYERLKSKYPLGLPAFERYNSFDDGKNSASLTIEEIVQCEEEIANFERNSLISKFYTDWLNTQKEFASKCRNIYNQFLKGWGCYFYNIDFNIIKPNGKTAVEPFKVWQLFGESYSSFEPKTYNPYQDKWGKAIQENERFITGGLIYRASYYDDILSFIYELNELYPNQIEVVLADSNIERVDLVNKHFTYLRDQIKEKGIICRTFTRNPLVIEEKIHYVVIELITSNSHLKDICETLLNTKTKCFSSCQKAYRHSCFSDIVYISLRKEYDDSEAQELIAKRIKEQEEEKRKQEEAERRKKEEEEKERSLKQKRQQLRSELASRVTSWHSMFNGFHYTYLLNYFPTTCDFEATEDEWEDRWTVWNFKNTPGKTSSTDYEAALETVIPQIKSRLMSTFGETLLKNITLVCIPASSSAKTKARYEVFSHRICNETGMSNAYNFMQVTSSSAEKKFGGSGITANNVSFDADFFRDKYVLLFDDVITKGESMLRFKRKMEELGAHVIGGMSIGKTKHNRI